MGPFDRRAQSGHLGDTADPKLAGPSCGIEDDRLYHILATVYLDLHGIVRLLACPLHSFIKSQVVGPDSQYEVWRGGGRR